MSENSPYEAPESDVSTNSSATKLTLKQIYLSFDGRIPRKVYWLYGVLGLTIVSLIAAGIIIGLAALVGQWFAILLFPLYAVILWSGLSFNAKRWHDRNKSAWFVLIGFVPILGLWQLVECGFLEGTQGDNQFGPAPGDY